MRQPKIEGELRIHEARPQHITLADEIRSTLPGWEPYSPYGLPLSDFTISKHYYDYLISVLINDTDDRGLQGGMIDLGMADPVKIHSNISGGVGILGCYTTSTKEFDVLEIVGKFPRK